MGVDHPGGRESVVQAFLGRLKAPPFGGRSYPPTTNLDFMRNQDINVLFRIMVIIKMSLRLATPPYIFCI